MRPKSPQSVANILSADAGGLQRLLTRTKALQRIDLLVQTFLPTPLNRHCRIANIKGGEAVMQVDSAAWHTRLRYQIPQLLAFLKAQPGLAGLGDIKIRVRPVEQRAEIPSRPAAMSADAATAISELAKSTSDPALSAALERLALRHKR